MNSCKKLEINKACFKVNSSYEFPVILNTQTSDCVKCPLEELVTLNHLEERHLEIDAVYATRLEITSNDQILLNETIFNFGEWGHYTLSINETGQTEGIVVQKQPVNPYLAIYDCILFFFILSLLWCVAKYLYRKEWLQNVLAISRSLFGYRELSWQDFQNDTSENSKVAKTRLRSLDVFRGLALVIMIFVNYKGGRYWIFEHSTWNGLTIADLVFPWFIWIMGTSLALSLRSQLRRCTSRLSLLWKILKRSIILFFLGLIINTLNNANDMSHLRIPGVLQRFSISYLVVASLHLCFAKVQDEDSEGTFAWLRDVYQYWLEWIVMLGFLMAHLLLTFLLAEEGCPRGYLGPGGLHDMGKHSNCTGGAAGFIDRTIFSVDHLYKHSRILKVYNSTLSNDPEGALGCLTSIFLVFLGLQAGKILLTYPHWKERTIRWLIWGIVTGGIALLLTKCSVNDGWIPINKNLWSASFIFAMAGTSFLLLALCYLVVDVCHLWTGAPFFFAGMNSILLYMGHEIMDGTFPWAWKIPAGAPHWYHLLVSMWGTVLWVVIAAWLYRKKFFVAI